MVSTFSMVDVEDVLEARALVENHTAAKSFAHRCELLPQVEEVHAAMVRTSPSTSRRSSASRTGVRLSPSSWPRPVSVITAPGG